MAGVAAAAGFAGVDVAGLEGAQEEPPRGAEREDMEMRAGCLNMSEHRLRGAMRGAGEWRHRTKHLATCAPENWRSGPAIC